jgi:hypothetical protein
MANEKFEQGRFAGPRFAQDEDVLIIMFNRLQNFLEFLIAGVDGVELVTAR